MVGRERISAIVSGDIAGGGSAGGRVSGGVSGDVVVVVAFERWSSASHRTGETRAVIDTNAIAIAEIGRAHV